MAYYVYILKCADKTLYIGSTNDVEKRVLAHNTLKTGARYTKSRRPVKLACAFKCRNLSAALKKEHALKKLSRQEKLALVQNSISRNKTRRPTKLKAVAA